MHISLAALMLHCAAAMLSASVSHAQDADTVRPLVEIHRFGDFVSAEALSADQFGNVFIVDAGTSTLRKFDLRGRLLAETGGPGWDNQQFDRPTGLDARPGITVYVADMGNSRVSRFDRDLNFMATQRGDDGTIDPGFGYPLDVVQSSLEQFFVLDGENARVLALRGLNSVERVFGGIESGEGRLKDPVALASDGSRLLYVLESDRVVVFDHFGSYLRQFGHGRFSDAQGIAVGRGIVLVVTPERLQLFTDDGTHVRDIGRSHLVLAGDVEEFRDAEIAPPHLLILTTHHCILFPVSDIARGS
ncbi:MAG: NHL repeat-containing protein [Bacteroidota bacterium]|nr:NHL repeat-containing protein [Bacteroidota bacterium]